jgi:hypothetical protein
VVAGEIIEVVEGVLGKAEEVLRLLFLERIGLDGDAKGEDGTTGLQHVVR